MHVQGEQKKFDRHFFLKAISCHHGRMEVQIVRDYMCILTAASDEVGCFIAVVDPMVWRCLALSGWWLMMTTTPHDMRVCMQSTMATAACTWLGCSTVTFCPVSYVSACHQWLNAEYSWLEHEAAPELVSQSTQSQGRRH